MSDLIKNTKLVKESRKKDEEIPAACGIRTHNLQITRRVLNRCATTTTLGGKNLKWTDQVGEVGFSDGDAAQVEVLPLQEGDHLSGYKWILDDQRTRVSEEVSDLEQQFVKEVKGIQNERANAPVRLNNK